MYEYNERESKLSVEKRYIHGVMSVGGANLVLTMHPRLAKYFHAVQYLCIDYTFKRVKGKIDEWEVAGFVERFKTSKSESYYLTCQWPISES